MLPKCSLPSSNSFFKNRGSKKWWKFGSILKVEPTYFLDGFDVGYEKMKVTEGMTQGVLALLTFGRVDLVL